MAARNKSNPLLIILADLTVRPLGGTVFELSRKFCDGAANFAAHWPGSVEVLLQARSASDKNLDNEIIDSRGLAFDISVLNYDGEKILQRLAKANVVLSTLGMRQLRFAPWSIRCGVPIVYVTEYSLETRKAIIRADTRNPILRLRRSLWTENFERRCAWAVRRVSGVQCNGTPTFEAYRQINSRPLLFFDTRTTSEMVIRPDELARRLNKMHTRPLRLVYSGRLAPMKGVNHLPVVAAELRRLGVTFQMDVFGDGPLRATMQSDAERLGVSDVLRLRGVVPFGKELVPYVSQHSDLFLCPHTQGDPACTYLETMACGVPIAGYANEAWRGLRVRSGGGWESPIGDPISLAQLVATIWFERSEIADKAKAARDFAAKNTLGSVMAERTEHLVDCANTYQSQ